MGDIDLLLTINGTEQAGAKLGVLDGGIKGLRNTALHTSAALQGIDGAMDELAKTGKITAATFTQLTFLLPLLANPLTAIAVGIGAIALEVVRLKNAETDLRLENFTAKMGRFSLASEQQINIAKALSGATVTEAETLAKLSREYNITSQTIGGVNHLRAAEKDLLSKLAAAQNLSAEETKNYSDVMRDAGETAKSYAKDPDKLRGLEAAMARNTENYVKGKAAIEAHIEVLTRDVSVVRALTTAEADLERQQKQSQTLAQAIAQTKAGTDLSGGAFSKKTDALREALRVETQVRDALIEKIKQQINVSGLADEATQNQAAASEKTIANLERQISLYDSLGRVIQDSLGGIAVGAFDVYADAIDKTISLNNLFANGTDRNMRNAAAAVVRNIGQVAAVHVAEELALAATTALSPAQAAIYGPAPQHLIAAGLWAGVASTAGVAAGALSVSGGGGAGSGGSVAGADRGGAGAGGGTTNVSVTVIGTLDDKQAEDLHNQITAAVQRRDLN